MSRPILALTCAPLLAVSALHAADPAPAKRPPNIVVILGDDFGYGDFGCYGATKVKTPNIDRMAAEGMRFTQGYATASTCTPTRYGLITGQYAWRKAGTHIQPGDAPLIIPEDAPNIASTLKGAGYATAAIGKWHLGLGRTGRTDYNKEIDAGPRTLGFDYSFLIPATGDRVPCVYVENHKVVNYDPADPIRISYGKDDLGSPTWKTHPELARPDHRDPVQEIRGGTIVNGICRIGHMTGGNAARWQDDSIADTLVNKAQTFIKGNKEKPFLLYFSTHDVHAPIAPNPRFLGTSQFGRRGDTVHQFDWCVGEILRTLKEQGLDDDTVVLLTSDNGACGVYEEQEKIYGQKNNGPLRGYKVELYEGGVREPFIVRWPGRVKPGATSDSLVATVDCLATFADIAGVKLPEGAGPDSVSFLPVLQDPAKQVRDRLIVQAFYSEPKCPKAIRDLRWKLIPGKKPADARLYDLQNDLGETTDVAAQHPDIVKRLADTLAADIAAGRSR